MSWWVQVRDCDGNGYVLWLHDDDSVWGWWNGPDEHLGGGRVEMSLQKLVGIIKVRSYVQCMYYRAVYP